MFKVKTVFGDIFTTVPTSNIFDVADKFFESLDKQTKTETKDFLFARDAIYEADSEFIVEIELSGVKKESISIDMDRDQIIVTATKVKKELGKVSCSNISYGEFSKRYKVLTTVNIDEIKAKFEDGVLTITIPKSEAKKAKKVNIT